MQELDIVIKSDEFHSAQTAHRIPFGEPKDKRHENRNYNKNNSSYQAWKKESIASPLLLSSHKSHSRRHTQNTFPVNLDKREKGGQYILPSNGESIKALR